MMSLQERIEELEEENLQLRQQLKHKDYYFPVEWKLTNIDIKLLSALMDAKDVLTKEYAKYSVWWDKHDYEPTDSNFKARMSILRVKVPFKIHLLWGRGYYISKEDKAKIKELCD